MNNNIFYILTQISTVYQAVGLIVLYIISMIPTIVRCVLIYLSIRSVIALIYHYRDVKIKANVKKDKVSVDSEFSR